MPDAEGAVERLYEDADVRDELRDDEANLLLKWAEDQLYKLAEQSSDDADFDARAAQFRGLLKGMNRLVGNRATLDAAALNQRLSDLAAQAASASAPGQFSAQAAPSIPAAQLSDVAGKLPALDDAGAVNALMALFNTLTPGPSPSGRGENEKPKDISEIANQMSAPAMPASVPQPAASPRVSPMIVPGAAAESLSTPPDAAPSTDDAMLYMPSLTDQPQEPHADDQTQQP